LNNIELFDIVQYGEFDGFCGKFNGGSGSGDTRTTTPLRYVCLISKTDFTTPALDHG